MAAPISQTELEPAPQPSKPVMSNCPECNATLAVLRIIPGRAGAEYWTMRCTRCGGIHLDIVDAAAPVPAATAQESGDLHVQRLMIAGHRDCSPCAEKALLSADSELATTSCDAPHPEAPLRTASDLSPQRAGRGEKNADAEHR